MADNAASPGCMVRNSAHADPSGRVPPFVRCTTDPDEDTGSLQRKGGLLPARSTRTMVPTFRFTVAPSLDCVNVMLPSEAMLIVAEGMGGAGLPPAIDGRTKDGGAASWTPGVAVAADGPPQADIIRHATRGVADDSATLAWTPARP